MWVCGVDEDTIGDRERREIRVADPTCVDKGEDKKDDSF